MVPPSPFSVTICTSRYGPFAPNGPEPIRDVVHSGFADLLAALNARTRAAHPGCDGGGLARDYTLVFHYKRGADVTIEINPDCQPSITNGILQSDNAEHVSAEINKLIGLR